MLNYTWISGNIPLPKIEANMEMEVNALKDRLDLEESSEYFLGGGFFEKPVNIERQINC